MRAVISIGTNTTRLLIVEGPGPRPRQVLHEARGTRIGEALREHGPLQPAAARRTLDAVAEFAALARERGARIAGIATSALRRAEDADAFAARFKALTGAPLQIIDGAQEARFSFLGAVAGLGLSDYAGVLDVGGGSSEYACGSADGVEDAVSCEIGAVRLTEAVPGLAGDRGPVTDAVVDRARDLAREALAPLRAFREPERLVGVGGTVFTAAGLLSEETDREKLSGRRITRAELEGLLARLLPLDLAARRALPRMVVQRADILPAGLIVVATAIELLEQPDITISASDLLYGYLVSAAAQDPA